MVLWTRFRHCREWQKVDRASDKASNVLEHHREYRSVGATIYFYSMIIILVGTGDISDWRLYRSSGTHAPLRGTRLFPSPLPCVHWRLAPPLSWIISLYIDTTVKQSVPCGTTLNASSAKRLRWWEEPGRDRYISIDRHKIAQIYDRQAARRLMQRSRWHYKMVILSSNTSKADSVPTNKQPATHDKSQLL